MKMKRFVAVFVSVMMVLGTMAAVPAFAEGETVSMGGRTYESLDLALEAIPDNGSAEITLGAGEYTLLSTFIIDGSKNITIIGAGKSITKLVIPGRSAFKIQGEGAGLKLKDLSLSIGEYKPINLLDADNVSFSAENVDVYADTTTILVYAKGVGAENSYRNGLNVSLENVNYNSNASLAAIYVQAYMGINLSVTGCSLITGPTGRTIRLHEPNSGMVSVSESTIEGFTPLYMHSRDTTMIVNDSTIIANDVLNTSVNDTSVIQVLGCTSDGHMNPGDGITYGYNNNITFNNCTLEARTVEPYAAIVGCSNAAKENTIQLNECKFITSGTVTVVEPNEPLTPLYTSSDASNTLILNGITYNDTTITEKIYMDMTNVPEDPLNYVTFLNLIPEAKIVKADKTVGYGSLSDAVAAAQDGDTVTLLSDVTEGKAGEGIVYDISGCTLDLNGFTYTAPNFARIFQGSNATIKNGKMVCADGGSYALFVGDEGTTDNFTVENVELSGGVNVYNASNVVLNNLTVVGTNYYAVWADENAFVTIESGTYNAGNAALFNVALMEDEESDTDIPSVITVKSGMFNANDKPIYGGSGGILSVSGGTFTSDVAEYVADGYYQKNNNDGTYTVLPAEAKVIDTAKTTGATVTLDNLNKNTAVDPAADATYKVVVETAPKADADAVNKAIEDSKKQGSTATPDNNTEKAIFDISVVKVDSNGTETVLNNVTNQKVTLTLGETPSNPNDVRVYHVDANGVTEIQREAPNYLKVVGNTVTFTATSFSTYAVTYNAAPLSNIDIAKEVSVAFDRVGDTNEYDIVLKGKDNSKLNRFMSADLTFDMTVTDGAVGYTIEPSTNINIVDNGNGRYEFNLDGLNASGATGAEVPIGKVIFEGNGTVKFGVKTEGVTTNIVNTAKSANNIVDDYIPGGRMVEHQQVGILKLDNKISETFTAPTKDLTVNIAYNNAISDQLATYQDMTVTISGGDLTTPIVKHLGSEGYTLTDNVYTVTVANELTQNVSYTVTVEGAGYRTARYTVNMATNKTLNFWNNVLDDDTYVEASVGTPSKTNFLAGDIVKDNNINIYDLSAVVSYFGTSNDVNAASAYARYDLNRDGKIDSKDVAYVLVSWNN